MHSKLKVEKLTFFFKDHWTKFYSLRHLSDKPIWELFAENIYEPNGLNYINMAMTPRSDCSLTTEDLFIYVYIDMSIILIQL